MQPDPEPRAEPVHYDPVLWNTGRRIELQPLTHALTLDFGELIEQRQTRREFSGPLEVEALGAFLWLACRNRSSRATNFGPSQESRSYPSAGAMHPVHVLLTEPEGDWLKYDPCDHALLVLSDTHESANSARSSANQCVPVGKAILIALVAEPGKTEAKYLNSETLVSRDIGIVLGYMSLVAEALGLSFCPLGITGGAQLAGVLPDTERLHGAGLCLLGRQ